MSDVLLGVMLLNAHPEHDVLLMSKQSGQLNQLQKVFVCSCIMRSDGILDTMHSVIDLMQSCNQMSY